MSASAPIENGVTNVCGLAPERTLRSFGFHPSDLLERYAPRTMDWLVTGPLVFSERLRQPADQAVYRAGDSLGFIDPFTGSGILNAMLTGELAGVAAARPASLRKGAVQHVPPARALLVRFVASTPKAAEELRQPLMLTVCFGLRLDCIQAPLVRTALRATIGPRPDATPRALTAGLFFSRNFFSRLDWHSHSRPPRFASPIVALMNSRINLVVLRIREVLTAPSAP
jgi:hypothetical protein